MAATARAAVQRRAVEVVSFMMFWTQAGRWWVSFKPWRETCEGRRGGRPNLSGRGKRRGGGVETTYVEPSTVLVAVGVPIFSRGYPFGSHMFPGISREVLDDVSARTHCWFRWYN